MDNFAKEQAGIEEHLPHLRAELSEIRETADEIDGWLALISRYTDIETLDRAIVVGLIDRMTVSERVKAYGRQMQELNIEYRFIGNLLQDTKKEGIA
jgi:septation ring formation regulator EzrA